MSDYNAPVQDMQFILENLCDMSAFGNYRSSARPPKISSRRF